RLEPALRRRVCLVQGGFHARKQQSRALRKRPGGSRDRALERASAGNPAATVRTRRPARTQERARRKPARAIGAVSARSPRAHGGALMPGKRVQIDDETWQALD